jgi:hypothetical protein
MAGSTFLDAVTWGIVCATSDLSCFHTPFDFGDAALYCNTDSVFCDPVALR